jgi:hypothetical protein
VPFKFLAIGCLSHLLGEYPKNLLVILLKRDEAIAVLKELLDNCIGLDGHYLELSPSNSASGAGGYQLTISKALDEETQNCMQTILSKHQLAFQAGSIWKTKRSANKTEPDTFIIYKPAQNKQH